MNRISRYLFSQIFTAVAFSLFALTLVVWFSQSIRLLSLVVNGGGSLWGFVKLMLLVLPTFLPLVLPISLVVGCLFVFNRLLVENEFQVMRAVGLGPWQLAKPVLLMAVIVMATGYLFTAWIAPRANHELVRLKYEIANDYSFLLLRTGTFHSVKDGISFYAESRGKDGELKNILIHDARRTDKPSTIMAESGEMIRTELGPNILVKNGIRQTLERDTGGLSQLSFKTYLVDLTTINNGFTDRWREPRERTMLELLNPEGTDKEKITKGRFLAEFNLRITMPLLAITFSLLACSFILNAHHDRSGMTKKIILITIIVVALEAVMLSSMNLIARHNWMMIILYLATLGPIPFAAYLLTDRTKNAPLTQTAP